MWPKLPPKSFFKRAKSVVAVRLVGLDFFLSAVLDRMIRIEHDSTGEIANRGPTGTEPCAVALRQNLRIAILEFLEVTDHVSTIPDAPINRDILIRQLRSIDIGENTAVSMRNEDTSNSDVLVPVCSEAVENTEGSDVSTDQLQWMKNSFSFHLIVLCVAVISGIFGYFVKLSYFGTN